MPTLIKREIFNELREHLDSPKITVLVGPRQAGKTTLLKLLMEDLRKQGKPYVYLNLDIEADFEKVRTLSDFLHFLKLELGTKKRGYVFIDEIQRKPNAGLFLKGLYDMGLNYKFVVSGSGSIELKEKVSEGLAGRKKVFKLGTVNFREFINYKTDYKYESKLGEYITSNFFDHNLFLEYLQYGGYPEVVTSETHKQKQDVLRSIFESFVDKDLKELLNLREPFVVRDILAYLSIQIGKLTTIDSIAEVTNLSFHTVKRYLFYLERMFIITKVRPYFTNPKLELTKTPVSYFNDLGMRNFVFNELSHFDLVISGSMLFQNFVFRLLSEQQGVSEINYWRTQGQAEVDFIVKSGANILPVEVKFKELRSDDLNRSIISFVERYKPKRFIIVNLMLDTTRDFNGTQIIFVPWTKLVDKNFVAQQLYG